MNLNEFITMNVAIIVFYTCYYCIFKEQTHFKWSRVFLISGIVTVFLIPFIPKEIFNPAIQTIPTVQLPEMVLTQVTNVKSVQISWWNLIVWGYFLVSITVIFRNILMMVLLAFNLRKQGKKEINDILFYESPHPYSFSFMGKIYLQNDLDEDEQKLVLKHELVHKEKHHYIDVLIIDLLKAILWINPFTHLTKKALVEIHEYEADTLVSNEKNKIEYQKLLVAKAFNIKKENIIQPFIKQSILKRRIMMINKERSSNKSKMRYALLLPIIGGLISISALQQSEVKKPVEQLEKVAIENDTVYGSFPGGNEKMSQFINDHFKYPESAYEKPLNSTIYAQFTINKDGYLSNFKILRGLSDALNQAAINAIKAMPKWKPSSYNGKPIATNFVLPIRITVSKKSIKKHKKKLKNGIK